MTYTDVITDAIEHRDATRFTLDALSVEYTKPRAQQSNDRIAGYHHNIRTGLKLAEVSALIGIAQQLQQLVAQDRGLQSDLDPGLEATP